MELLTGGTRAAFSARSRESLALSFEVRTHVPAESSVISLGDLQSSLFARFPEEGFLLSLARERSDLPAPHSDALTPFTLPIRQTF